LRRSPVQAIAAVCMMECRHLRAAVVFGSLPLMQNYVYHRHENDVRDMTFPFDHE
jgi:hypothetical protein